MKKISIKDLFSNDRFLKVLSVVVAVVAWFLVSTMIDPNATSTVRDVPVTINLTNTAAGTNGLSVISTGEVTVDISIKGKSYEIGNLTADDFEVSPTNLSTVTAPGTYDLDLKVTTTAFLSSGTEYTVKPATIPVVFDRIEKKNFQLEASAPNKEPEEGYYIDEYIASPNSLEVSGPESVISQVARCVVENTDKMKINNSTAIDGNLIFYDANGQRIDASLLEYTDTKFKISIPLYKKETLPLSFEYINVPKGINTEALEYAIQPVSEINVAIPVDAAGSVESISLGQVDFRKLDVKKTLTFDVSLLAGYINIDDINQVEVTFLNDEYDKTYLSSENIITANVPAGYTVGIISTKVSDIRFIGKKDILPTLTPEDIVITADFSNIQNLTVGEQRVPVSITVADGKQAWAVGEKSILVSVSAAVPTEEAP